jgi:hypothetical protein
MIDKSPKKLSVSITFDIIDDIGVDCNSVKMCVDGKPMGCLHNLELSVNGKDKLGRLQYSQFRNPMNTEQVKDCGTWEIHAYGDKELND